MKKRRFNDSPWRLIPSRDPDDQLYNRRLLSYFGLAYSALWFLLVLLSVILISSWGQSLDAGVVIALLGVPASLAGLGFFEYLSACKREDKTEGKNKNDGKNES